MRLVETLAQFRERLRARADSLEVGQRQKILRLLVKEILVGKETITIRHSIPAPHSGEGRTGRRDRLPCRRFRPPARLQGIPRDLHEAAVVDGAGGIRRFWSVTLPLLGPTLLFVVIVLSTRAFQAYGEIDLLTDGGPRPYDSTTTLTYLIYGQNSIINNNAGLQAATAVLLFLVLLGTVAAAAGRHRTAGALWRVTPPTMYDRPVGWRAVGRYGLLVVISVLVLFPVYTMVVAALKPGNKVLVNPLVPDAFTLDVLARGVDRRPPRALPVQLDRRRRS